MKEIIDQKQRTVKEGRLEKVTRELGDARAKLVGTCKTLRNKVEEILGSEIPGHGESKDKLKQGSVIGELEDEVVRVKIVAKDLDSLMQSLESL